MTCMAIICVSSIPPEEGLAVSSGLFAPTFVFSSSSLSKQPSSSLCKVNCPVLPQWAADLGWETTPLGYLVTERA